MTTPDERPDSPYTVEYFLAKFSAIPDDQWCLGDYADGQGRRCAFGHCGVALENYWANVPEARALDRLLGHIPADDMHGYGVAIINDGRTSTYQQPTPKARILAALHDIAAARAVRTDGNK